MSIDALEIKMICITRQLKYYIKLQFKYLENITHNTVGELPTLTYILKFSLVLVISFVTNLKKAL